MAHKKAGGSSKNGRDSKSKRLGIKKFGGEAVQPGNILLRQRGTQFHPGNNTVLGKDHTITAKIDGMVNYTRTRTRRIVSVIPHQHISAK